MKKNGFILLESIVMFVVLITALVMLYISANNFLVKEKTYSNYDDVASIYSAYYLTEALKDFTNINAIKASILANCNCYGIPVGLETIGMSYADYEGQTEYLNTVASKLKLYQMYLVGTSTSDLRKLKECANGMGSDSKCKNTYMDENLRAFIKAINIGDFSKNLSNYYLIVEFRRSNDGGSCSEHNCTSQFTWMAL